MENLNVPEFRDILIRDILVPPIAVGSRQSQDDRYPNPVIIGRDFNACVGEWVPD